MTQTPQQQRSTLERASKGLTVAFRIVEVTAALVVILQFVQTYNLEAHLADFLRTNKQTFVWLTNLTLALFAGFATDE